MLYFTPALDREFEQQAVARTFSRRRCDLRHDVCRRSNAPPIQTQYDEIDRKFLASHRCCWPVCTSSPVPCVDGLMVGSLAIVDFALTKTSVDIVGVPQRLARGFKRPIDFESNWVPSRDSVTTKCPVWWLEAV